MWKEEAECGFGKAIRQIKNAFSAMGSFSAYFAYSAVSSAVLDIKFQI